MNRAARAEDFKVETKTKGSVPKLAQEEPAMYHEPRKTRHWRVLITAFAAESGHLLWHIGRRRRKAVAGRLSCGDRQRRDETWVGIAKPELAAMQRRHRRGETEAEARARLAAA